MQKYKQLNLEERFLIFSLLEDWLNKKEIAEAINRHPSTITRELQRNKTRVRYSHNKYPKFHYLPDSAENTKIQRRKQANKRPFLKNIFLQDYIIKQLKSWWSPDIISWVLKHTFCNNFNLNISSETIYKAIYSKTWEQLNLKQYLLRKHKRRKIRSFRNSKKSKIQNQINIEQRKNYFPNLETRKEFWHFEGDSILSMRTTYSALRTEVERKTRFVFAEKINKKSKEETKKATIKIFSKIHQKTKNKNTIKSTTWDNWLEHANHQKIIQQLKENYNINLKIFFADPYKSWQRWTNENANWIIRRYFPKWTNFDKVTNQELQKVINKINNTPRKILNYKTAKQCFIEELKKLWVKDFWFLENN